MYMALFMSFAVRMSDKPAAYFMLSNYICQLITPTGTSSSARVVCLFGIRQMHAVTARFMRPIWGLHDPGGSHVGPMNFAIWVFFYVLSFMALGKQYL